MADGHWRLIASLLRPHRRAVAVYGAAQAAATAVPLAGSVALARFVGLVVDGAPGGQRVLFGLLYAASGLAASIMTVLVTWRATVLAWAITDGLRHELVAYVLHADLAFHRDRTPGELVTRVDGDVNAMTQFLGVVVARVVSIVALGLAAVVVMAFVEPLLAMFLLVGVGGVAVVTWRERETAQGSTVAERTSEAEMMSVAEQYLAGAEDIAALGAGAHGVRRMGDACGRLVDAAKNRVRDQMRVQTSIRVALGVAEVFMIAAGAWLMRRDAIDVAGVVLGYRFVAVITRPVEGLTWRMQEAQGAVGAARRVLDFLAEGRQAVSGTLPPPIGAPDLVFENVSLIYDDDAGDGGGRGSGRGSGDASTAALRAVSLRVPAGRVLGVLGRSGSGKTSLARLALGLIAPTNGQVTIGGVVITDIEEVQLRRRLTAVPQDVQLFPGSVRDNVTLFAEGSDDDVRAALVEVGLDPWLQSLTDGLDTVLTGDGRDDEGGRVGLSAGEAQLLSLARAVFRQPDLVVLDEATSRVDPQTQERIGDAVRRLLRGRTGIVIAHRLETLDVCDDIAVLADGVLVEHGTRAELGSDPTSRYHALRHGAIATLDNIVVEELA